MLVSESHVDRGGSPRDTRRHGVQLHGSRNERRAPIDIARSTGHGCRIGQGKRAERHDVRPSRRIVVPVHRNRDGAHPAGRDTLTPDGLVSAHVVDQRARRVRRHIGHDLLVHDRGALGHRVGIRGGIETEALTGSAVSGSNDQVAVRVVPPDVPEASPRSRSRKDVDCP